MKKTAQVQLPATSSQPSDKKGFTLIELLIVISIIAVLSAIGAVVYSSAQKNGRISRSIQDLQAIAGALEVYHTSNGSYPLEAGSPPASNINSLCSGNGMSQVGSAASVIPGLVPNFMAALPSDPAMNIAAGTSCYAYKTDPAGVDYKIYDIGVSEMSASDYQKQPQLVDPQRNNVTSTCPSATNVGGWAIWTVGAQCW